MIDNPFDVPMFGSEVDPRSYKVADLLVNYSTQVKPGDRVLIQTDSFASWPWVRAVYKKVLEVGGIPMPHIGLDPMTPEIVDPLLVEYASDDLISRGLPLRNAEMDMADVYIRIGAATEATLKPLMEKDEKKYGERVSAIKKTAKQILDTRLKKRWVVTRYPTQFFADEAGIPHQEFSDFVYGTIVGVDYNAIKERNMKIKNLFDQGKEVHVVGFGPDGDKDTDILFSIEGRAAESCHGTKNVPDGEVYYSPQPWKTKGFVKFTYPWNENGVKINGIRLEFDNDGRIINETSDDHQELLTKILNTDKGARRLGELGIGTNPAINRFMNNLLFDEKIYGTVHITPGNDYPETTVGIPKDERNSSAIHMDIVRDLRKISGVSGGGYIELDWKKVQENGVWIL